MAEKLTFQYDREADILYINTVTPYAEQESEELGDDVIARLNQEIARGYRAPDIRERLEREGNDVVVASPELFDAFFRGEMSKWAKVIRDAGIKLD